MLFLFGVSANTTTYTVNSLNDSGAGTLRDAINLATSPGDLINFSVSGTIILVSTLPAITNSNLTIDGGNNISVSGNNAVKVLLVNAGAGLSLENIIIENGHSNTPGGGIGNGGTGSVILQNTIVANSPSGGDCGGPHINADSSNMADDASCGLATQVTPAQLNLGPLQNNGGPTDTIALLPGSVAIDAGNNAYAIAAGLVFDQRGPGFPRYINGIVDVGAFEFQATPSLFKSFFPPIITTNATSTLTITLNFTPNVELTSPFTDNLPTSLSIVGAATTTCGLPISNTASSITLNPPPNPPGILPASGTCRITATVTSALPGIFDNILPPGALVVSGAPNTLAVSAQLFVNGSPCFLRE